MSQRNSGISGNSQGGANARHDFKRNSGFVERLSFLTTTPKEKRIAALKSHHALSYSRVVNEQAIDFRLGSMSPTADFADIDAFGLRGRKLHYFGINQIVINHDVA